MKKPDMFDQLGAAFVIVRLASNRIRHCRQALADALADPAPSHTVLNAGLLCEALEFFKVAIRTLIATTGRVWNDRFPVRSLGETMIHARMTGLCSELHHLRVALNRPDVQLPELFIGSLRSLDDVEDQFIWALTDASSCIEPEGLIERVLESAGEIDSEWHETTVPQVGEPTFYEMASLTRATHVRRSRESIRPNPQRGEARPRPSQFDFPPPTSTNIHSAHQELTKLGEHPDVRHLLAAGAALPEDHEVHGPCVRLQALLSETVILEPDPAFLRAVTGPHAEELSEPTRPTRHA